jgi:hypothetical protein
VNLNSICLKIMIEIQVSPKSGQPVGKFDLLVVCLGYETRSLFIADKYRELARHHLALAFQKRLVGNYDYNRDFYTKNKFTILPFDQDEFCDAFNRELVSAITRSEGRPRILIDISSMSRPMIATVAVELGRAATALGVEVIFVYCPAVFTKPSNIRHPVAVSQPVIPELAGWSVQPERSVATIVGLGFEYDQALGAIEYLEPAAAWTFIPFGEDVRFDKAVDVANKDLLMGFSSERIVYYDVSDPYKCFVELEALTYGLMDNMRPIIVPFGPKIFALLSVLIGVIHAPNVTIWRVSGDQNGKPEDRVASGKIVALNTVFSSSN